LKGIRIQKSSIFPKLVATFTIVMIPLFALSLVLNELGKQEVQSQISNAMKAQLRYEFSALEQELSRISKAQRQLINDGELLDLSSQIYMMSDYQRTKKINNLHDKLLVLKDSSLYIQNVSVYIPDADRIISTGTVYDAAAFRTEAEQIALAIYKDGFPLTRWNGRLFLSLTYPNRQSAADFGNRPPQFIHNIELSADAFQAMLNRISQDGGAALYTDTWTIMNDKDKALLADIRGELEKRKEDKGPPLRDSISAGGTRYFVFYERSAQTDLVLASYIPEHVLLGKLQSYRVWFWLLVGCSLIIVLLFSYGIYLLLQRPLSTLIRLLRNVEEGNFRIVKSQNRKDEFGYLFHQFERTVRKLKHSIDELYVQKIRLQQTELKQLQAQITPHFLYNSFFILHQLIVSYDNEKAESVSRNLGEYFQYITRNSMDEVPLESEVNHVRSYLEIQNIRFSNRISATFDALPEKFRDIRVPRLILQPIIENAYQHGLADVVTGGQLHIGFLDRDDELCIAVEDNGTGMTEPERDKLRQKLSGEQSAGESTGLINVHRRLRIKYGGRGGLEVEQGEPGGLLVYIHIPFGKENEDVSIADR